jgi:hypothetical protein
LLIGIRDDAPPLRAVALVDWFDWCPRPEQQLKLAEVATAKEYGFRICRRHWSPGIMLDEGVHWRCRDCGATDRDFVIA